MKSKSYPEEEQASIIEEATATVEALGIYSVLRIARGFHSRLLMGRPVGFKRIPINIKEGSLYLPQWDNERANLSPDRA